MQSVYSAAPVDWDNRWIINCAYIYIYCYGTYQHGSVLFLRNIYRLYLIFGEITSKQSGAYALLSGRRWDGTHFGSTAFYQCTDLVGCVLVPVSVARGAPWLESSSLREPSLSDPPRRGLVYHKAPEVTLFMGMLTEPDACLVPPVMSGLRPCTRTQLKRPCATLIWLVECATNTDNLQAGWNVCITLWEVLGKEALRSAAFYRVCPSSSINRSRFTLFSILEPQRPTLPDSSWRG